MLFDRIKKAFTKDPQPGTASSEAEEFAPVAEWARGRGFAFSTLPGGFSLEGPMAGKPCRLELGRPSRQYIQGGELRGRAELDIDPDLMLVLMSRPLKDELVKQAYAQYTDTLRTSVDAQLPEEVRLLAMYDEVGWDGLPRAFWTRYALVAEHRSQAAAWLDDTLSQQLVDWPAPGTAAEDLPFMLMLLRGRAYLRMQQGGVPAMQYATQVFRTACENAVRAFPPRAQ
jgi:hypothetical protein